MISSEEIKEEVNELDFKVEKISAENDHTLKSNKLLQEKIDKLKAFILEMHTCIKEAQETYINLSSDHINHFDRVEKLLVDKKLKNFENLLDKALEAGAFVKDLMSTIDAYKTKPFQYSYANVAKKKLPMFSPEPTKQKVEKLILTESQKRDKLIDAIFTEMKKNKKVPNYYQDTISKLEKLKLIRDHFQSLYSA